MGSREVVAGLLIGALAGCGRIGFSDRKGFDASTDTTSAVDGPIGSDGPRPMITRVAVADGSVRDGLGTLKNGVPDTAIDNSVVQVGDVPNFEDRGIVEFALPPGLTVTAARIDLGVFSSMGPFPFPIEVFGYDAGTSADGLLAVSDWTGGTSLGTFMYGGETTVSFDVTAALATAATTSSAFVGIRFEFQVPSAITLNGPFVAFNSNEFPPAAQLTITE